MLIPAVWAVREAAARSQCQNSLHQLALGLRNYQDAYGSYPRGTVPGTDLPPGRRLSSYIDILPFLQGGWKWLFDVRKPWDDEANNPIRAECKTFDTGDRIIYKKRVIGELPLFFCPSNPRREEPGLPSLTHYVGMSGLGVDAAAWPLEHADVGVFGYDRVVRPRDVKDGQANTLAFIETGRDNGPWSAGGPATVRGLDPDVLPYLGRDGQFTAFHRGVNTVFLDGTVRNLSTRIDPRVFRSLVTIAGGEEVSSIGY
jgi:hypothetical protein